MPASTNPTPIRKEPRRKAGQPVRISSTVMAKARHRRAPQGVPSEPFEPYLPPPGVLPANTDPQYAADTAFNGTLAWATDSWAVSAFLEGTTFLGYPYLAQLAQRPEYRVASEVIAQDCTREWIELKTKGDEDKSAKIAELEDELTRLHVQMVFQVALEKDGQFGRAHIYIDTGQTDDKDELKLDIGNGRSKVSQAKVGKGDLKELKVIEPMWAYPTRYNSSDPLAADWYNPDSWGVMSQEIHRSRFLTIIGRPVPDILKPAYAFGGLSLSQMMKPYVDNWLRTRQAVSDLVASFVVNVLKTNLGTQLQAGGEGLFTRVDFFNAMRDNHGALVIDKDTEEWTNVQTSLGSLDLIQAQSQEHMASINRIPLVKLLGIQPAGLNASSEDVIKTYDDTIHAYQEGRIRDPLTTIIGFAQLNLWGEVDPDITFDFKPLRQLNEQEKAQIEQTKAATDDVYVAMGAVQPEDVQKRLQADEDSPYHGLELEPPPEPPDMLGAEPDGEYGDVASDPASRVAEAVISALSNDNDSPEVAAVVAQAVRQAVDAAFEESKHPRGQPDNAGQFGPGGGGGSSKKTSPASTTKTSHLTAASTDRAKWPKHIQSLKLPPAWVDVRISHDADADLLAIGRDAKGREQRVYAARFAQSQQAKKFARIKVLDRRIGAVTRRNDVNLRSRDSTTRELAACQDLIMKMGLRPGSERETGAAERAYGATTLEGRHVVTNGNVTRLVFTGKKGVKLDLPVADPALAAVLRERAKKTGASGRLFGDVTDERLRRYVKTLGGDFKVKDFRTYLGTSEAAKLVAMTPAPNSPTAYKRTVINVAKKVAEKLGNTPSIALKAYISPFVFSEWKHAAGIA